MKSIVIYDSYVFSQIGIRKVLLDAIPDCELTLCSDKVDAKVLTYSRSVDLLIISVWDYQYIEDVIKFINPSTQIIIYYEYLMPVITLKQRYKNIVSIVSKQVELEQFVTRVEHLLQCSSIADYPSYAEPNAVESAIYSTFYE